MQYPFSKMLNIKLEGNTKPPLLIESKYLKCSGFMSKLNGFSKFLNITLQDGHSVFSIVSLAMYPDLIIMGINHPLFKVSMVS